MLYPPLSTSCGVHGTSTSDLSRVVSMPAGVRVSGISTTSVGVDLESNCLYLQRRRVVGMMMPAA